VVPDCSRAVGAVLIVVPLLGLATAIFIAVVLTKEYRRSQEADAKLYATQAEAAEAARSMADDDEDDDRTQMYIHCDYNQDDIRSFYEVPDALRDLVKAHDPDRTFAECLSDLVDP
jgi:phosphate/sulfate permease